MIFTSVIHREHIATMFCDRTQPSTAYHLTRSPFNVSLDVHVKPWHLTAEQWDMWIPLDVGTPAAKDCLVQLGRSWFNELPFLTVGTSVLTMMWLATCQLLLRNVWTK